ncbi:MAG: serine hydrolase domain-containing protein [Coxiellaceae bacterium]|nr:serine hydrolase domain-containing protein [Coxiellaceae bacterium]
MLETTERRNATSHFAIPYVPVPKNDLSKEPAIFTTKNALPETLREITQEAQAAFQIAKKCVQKYSIIAELIESYETGLATTENIDSFKAEFLPKLYSAHAEFFQQKSEHYFEYHYSEAAKRVESSHFKLEAWLKENPEYKEDPEVQELQGLLAFRGLAGNFYYPGEVINALTINLSKGRPHGCWYSNAEDMHAFAKALWHPDGALHQYAAEIEQRKVITRPGNPDQYGCGSAFVEIDGVKAVAHSGKGPGICTNFSTYPESGYTFVTLSNDDASFMPLAYDLENFIARQHVPGSAMSVAFLDPKVSVADNPFELMLENIAQIAEVEKVENNLLPPMQIAGSETPGKNIFDSMQALNVPNASVTVIADGKVAWTREYDLATRSAHEPSISKPSVFQAGSISKTINAVLAMKVLVESGKIKLHEDLTPRLKAMGIENNTGKEITLAQLLSHTAGTSVHGFPGYHSSHSAIPTTDEILAGNPALKNLKPNDSSQKDLVTPNTMPVEVAREPGKECVYSGGGTTIIQKLIEDVTGRLYEDVAKEIIFDPLHMDSSTFERQLPGETALNIQKGHLANGDVLDGGWRVHPELAAAALWTTTEDLAKFSVAMNDAFHGKDNSCVTQETAKAMVTLQPNSDFGLGFKIDGQGDSFGFGHGGATDGYRADYVVFPNQNVGAVILTNGDNGNQLIQEIQAGLAEVYSWPARECERKTPVALEESSAKCTSGRFIVTVDDKDIAFFPRVENGQLHLSIPFPQLRGDKRMDLILTPTSQREFICVEPILFRVAFNEDYSGMILGGGLSATRSNSPQTSEQALFGKTHAQTSAVPRPVSTTQNEHDKKDPISGNNL